MSVSDTDLSAVVVSCFIAVLFSVCVAYPVHVIVWRAGSNAGVGKCYFFLLIWRLGGAVTAPQPISLAMLPARVLGLIIFIH